MSIIDKIIQRMGYTRKAEASGRQLPYIQNDMGYQDTTLTYNQAELYRRLAAVFTAVDVPSKIGATVPLNVRKIRGEKTSEIDNHPFELLLKRPNPNQSRMEFIKNTLSYWLLTGNSYWHMVRTSENAPPAELWNIPPDRIKRIVTDGQQLVTGYEYDAGSGQLTIIPAWQVIHFKDFHPNSVFSGLSRVETIAVDASTDLNTSKWVNKLYGQNNARLPGILTFADSINDTDWDRIQADARSAAEKRQILMLRGTGQGAVNWLKAAGNLAEMEYIAGRNFTKEEIYSVFAPGLASMLAINATEANSKTGKATLIDFVVWPMLCMMGEKITGNILPAYVADKKQLSLVAEFDDIRVTDRVLELQEIAEFAKTHTIDEIREKYYEDKPLAEISGVEADKRGIMLVAQIGQSTPAPSDEEEPEPEETQPIPPQFMQTAEVEETEEAQEEPEEKQTEQPTDTAYKADLERWHRKATNALKRGEPANVSYTTLTIPDEVCETITAGLADAKTAQDITRVFKGVTITTPRVEYGDGIMALAAELKRANDLLEKAE